MSKIESKSLPVIDKIPHSFPFTPVELGDPRANKQLDSSPPWPLDLPGPEAIGAFIAHDPDGRKTIVDRLCELGDDQLRNHFQFKFPDWPEMEDRVALRINRAWHWGLVTKEATENRIRRTESFPQFEVRLDSKLEVFDFLTNSLDRPFTLHLELIDQNNKIVKRLIAEECKIFSVRLGELDPGEENALYAVVTVAG